MRAVFSLLCLTASLTFFASSGAAETGSHIILTDAFAPPTLAGSTMGVVYLTAHSDTDETFIAASTPVAKKAELHTHIKDGDIMRMRQVKKIELPAGKSIQFTPGGLHVMLYDVQKPLKDGDRFPLTFMHKDGGEVMTIVTVSQARLLQEMKSRMSK